MYKFFIDKGNLRATAQLLHDAKRVDPDLDVDAVQEMLKQKLNALFAPLANTLRLADCPCIYGPVFCMPAIAPTGSKTDIILNLTVRPSDPEIAKWTFEAL
ncbi:hypothetical protein [Pseudomonas chlororaphis]|uniref:hypothetical protein n=1 Tax=Pseudomonas chlororaphis TaxID=587753 RepID=UPI0006A6532F|nr:hypothetical protein [Pseudomonas chlororaphis]MBM0285031.1 hypothetical protein [Pseudomonas chlororaphis]MDO1505704.1 hypothetical protein [Pseudomonas chlororaphis]ORM49830.1 hypothetical protein B6D51_01430 [Pseudomonas chlororaphis subsp. chlororaphis]TWR99107.1 hypothetical protein FJD36_03840 [Pseudomonas chlororaphis subsp. chlororaphis]WDG99724.1 hypothetical protein PUP54_09195 [Pseudomonas chlororaphis]